ncbi:hypothetical protein BC830DRAFT_1165325 [Chytriomyces sp. MP71]|nr:hypothetical protein BC830DRAFT_1165325 [Chytriomyces sp. MP71]
MKHARLSARNAPTKYLVGDAARSLNHATSCNTTSNLNALNPTTHFNSLARTHSASSFTAFSKSDHPSLNGPTFINKASERVNNRDSRTEPSLVYIHPRTDSTRNPPLSDSRAPRTPFTAGPSFYSLASTPESTTSWRLPQL